MRKPISAAEYLAATLRFLATGESYSSLEFQFRISKSTLSNMIPYVCNVIYTVLKDDYLACPQSELEWLNIAKEFQDRWQFPNCLGAGDGKHIRLLCPSNSGSEYYNYKGYYSLVLMAFVGPEYQFLFVDVGCQGSISDGGVFCKTSVESSGGKQYLSSSSKTTATKSWSCLWRHQGYRHWLLFCLWWCVSPGTAPYEALL